MKHSTNLHELIHSLDRNEKGYFVKFAKIQGEKSIYLQLFQALCELPQYDREALEQRFDGSSFLEHLAVHQNYLYRMILKSLRLYYEKQQVEIQLYAQLSEVAVLELKGLKKQAGRELKKAKKKALLHFNYPILLEILRRQAIQLVATRTPDLLNKTLEIYKEVFELLKNLKEEYTYRQFSHTMLLCFRMGTAIAPKRISKHLKKISSHSLMNGNQELTSFYSQFLRFNINCIEAQIYGDHELAHENYLEILRIWEAHPAIIKANPHIYKIHITNYLGNAISLRRVDDFEYYIEVMEDLNSRNMKERIEDFQNIVYLKLLFCLGDERRLDQGKDLVKEIEAKLDKWAAKLNPARAVAIYYNIVTLFFIMEDFQEAQKWLYLISIKQDKEIHGSVKSFARIMQLVIHFELKSERLDYWLATNKRELKNSETNRDYEKTIFDHFQYLIKSPLAERRKTCRGFTAALEPFTQLERKPVGIDELLIWLQARIKGRSLREVYRDRLAKDHRS